MLQSPESYPRLVRSLPGSAQSFLAALVLPAMIMAPLCRCPLVSPPDGGLSLDISTDILGSLAGYAGGPILPGGVALSGIYSPSANWWLTTGSLTPTPEPASLCLLVLGSGVLGALGKRLLRA